MSVRFFTTTVRVSWADTDAARVVWFGQFLHYLEVAEVALFDAHGRSMSALFDAHEILLPRTSLTIAYRSPARFDDLLDVGLGVASLTERRVGYVFQMHQHESRRLVAEGSYEVAAVASQTFKSRSFPDDVRAVFAAAIDLGNRDP